MRSKKCCPFDETESRRLTWVLEALESTNEGTEVSIVMKVGKSRGEGMVW
jgi:hypothetical protein